MNWTRALTIAAATAVLAVLVIFGATARSAQDRNAVKVPGGLAFSEFKGYDTWEDVAVSETRGQRQGDTGESSDD